MNDYSKEFKVLLLCQDGFAEERLAEVARISTGYDFGASCEFDGKKNALLLQSLFKMKHFSVFEFAGATFQVECPIYVARQLMRYRNASYIERSLRRCKPLSCERAVEYEDALKNGEKKEDARGLLPLSARTRFLWKMNLREMLHVFDERLTKETQPITRAVVESIFDEVKKTYPIIISCWEKERDGK
ncbi:MAG: FAD-dependent thymidylate synthase [Thermoguttaceae bacterium]